MSQGLSITAASAALGFTRECAYQWSYTIPDFKWALELGRGKRLFFLERGLLAAKDYPTVTSRIFALKNADRHEWGGGQVIEHSGKEDRPWVTKIELVAGERDPSLPPLDITE